MRRLMVGLARKMNPRRQILMSSVALAGLALLAGGCAAVAPIGSAVSTLNTSPNLQIFNTTELRLQQKNFVMVKSNVIGESKGFALLGIITIVPARFDTAMNRLSAHADLKPGSSRTVANLHIWPRNRLQNRSLRCAPTTTYC